MGYIPSWSPGIWGRTPVAPCNEHPVECDGAERLRHVTTRDNDTTSECYTSATPGHSRRQPTTLVTTLVTHRVTSRDNIRDTESDASGGRNLRRNKTIDDNKLYNNKVVPEPF